MKITDTERLSIFILGFRLVSYEGSWWISRPRAWEGEDLMLSVERKADPAIKGHGYFKSPRAAMDSFLRNSRYDAEIRAEKRGTP